MDGVVATTGEEELVVDEAREVEVPIGTATVDESVGDADEEEEMGPSTIWKTSVEK